MHASSSTSAQQSSVLVAQQAASPTPQQANKQTLKNAQNASDTPPKSDELNTHGSRGTQLNITA